jgi:formate C-acetyltransferase
LPSSQFEDFLAGYYRRLAREIAKEVAVQDNCRRNDRAPHGGKPLQSVFTRDCIARGLDIDRGGATYNWVECSFVGMANLADSLQVIREEVFAKRTITLADLKAAMATNFAGMEPLRLRLLNGQPKYGNDCAQVDALVARTAAFCQAQCATHKIWPDDSPFVPGAFCWIMHEVLGRQTGATPDGRKAGFPFADGGGPAQGRERLGPTAAILSATSWDHSPMIGGLAYNMKFNSSLLEGAAARDRLRDLVITYLRRGGFETQINVVDRSTLLAARERPEQYRDLAVRIGGYVDYFTRLSFEMQEEVLMRTEFAEL